MADSVNVFVGSNVLLSGGNVITVGTLGTDGIAEGVTNLYYTEARVSANTTVQQNITNISSINSDLTSNYINKSKAIIDVNTTTYTTGQWVYGIKAGINSGKEFIGICQTFPPTSDAHIKFIYRES